MGQVAGSGVGIELGTNEPLPSCGHRIQRSRQHKHKSAIRHAGEAAALQGAGADALERQHAKQFSEAFDCFVQERSHGFWRAIAAGQTGTTAGDHDIHFGIGDPAAQLRADPVAIIRA